ncbi:MAG: family 10 glycosylhydrolase [Polyangiales bacterium]
MELVKRVAALACVATLAASCGGEDPAASADASSDAPARDALDGAEDALDGAEDAGDVAVLDASSEASVDAAGDAPSSEVDAADASSEASVDAAAMDAARADVLGDVGGDVVRDAAPTDAPDASTLADVSHPRELRGVWVATVGNINFPSHTGLSVTAAQAELTSMLDVVQRNRLNVVVFQVRPEGDAVYRSSIEPWSRYLTGRQGGDPGFDPLDFLVAQAHRRSIEVHAWFNPYRAKSAAGSAAVSPHISVTNPEAVVTYGSALWMDPSRAVVQDRLAAVIRDVVTRYDVDGVHFDDYFYPYPISGTAFPDSAQYDRYRMGGGALSLSDWRRDNVNRMVERVSTTVATARADVRFGISPFGIYRPGMPAGISGLDAYNAIYCDPVLWMRQGWVDYLAPQLYWPSTQTAQAYGTLIAWWAALATGGRSVFAGNNLGQLGSSSAWSLDEFRRQVTLTRAQADRGARGNIWFTVQPFQSNRMGVADAFRAEFYQRPALTPPMAGARPRPAAPTVTVDLRTLRITHPEAARLRSWVVYRDVSGAWEVDQIVPASQSSATVTAAGTYAVSASNRFGDESLGARATVR